MAAADAGGVQGRWPIQLKVGLGFAAVTLVLLFNTVAFFIAQDRQETARSLTMRTFDVLGNLQALQIEALNQEAGLNSYQLTANSGDLRTYNQGKQAFTAIADQLRQLTKDLPRQQQRMDLIEELIGNWQNEIAEPARRRAADSRSPAELIEQANKSRHYFDQLHTQIKEMQTAELGLLNERSAILGRSVSRARWLTVALLVFEVVVAAYAVRTAHNLILRPLVDMTGLMTRLAAHDRSIEVPSQNRRDEIGDMARALQAFKQLELDSSDERWIKSHVSDISGWLQQTETLREFGEKLTSSTATLTNSGFVVFYGICSNRIRLEWLSSYGLLKPPAEVGYEPGDGLVGECGRQRQTILLTDLPDHYPHIQSGTVDAPPRNVLLLPMLSQGRLLGVLELAAFKPFSPVHRQFLEDLMPIAALSYDNLGRAVKTQQLLEESVIKSQELQSSEEALRLQQEELRATNEALQAKTDQLEQQSSQLRASREELKLQAEELQVSNEELTEKSATLQEQRLILEALQRETQDKADALARASQYKSEFLANMSHELRTPLNSLLILSRSLSDNEEGHLDADEVESAMVIHDSGSKLLQLINDILDLSKVEAGKMQIVYDNLQLSSFIEGLRRNFRHVARERQLAFDLEIEDGLPQFLTTDGARLDQIANNLIGNAFKFTKQGGVRVRIARPSPAHKLPGQLVAASTIAIQVIDSGIGIPQEKLYKMFQAFEQVDAGTSRHYGGTGLGLSIARGLARLLGGDITLVSEIGVGTTFTVFLPEQPPPLAREMPPEGDDFDDDSPMARRAPAPLPAAPAPPVAATPPPLPSNTPTLDNADLIADDRELIRDGDTVILLIEDDPVFARILADLIRRKGYRALAAGNGENGLALARKFQPKGILLNVMLPGMDGWTVLDKLKHDPQLSPIPVHFISATEEAARGVEAGAIGFLTKPVSKSALLDAFDRLLQNAPDAHRSVLLIDDDAGSRTAMRHLLAEAGVELIDADSGEAALALMAKTSFNCIVLDLGLPGMSGFEFLERASLAGPLPSVVIHSGRELTRDESMRLRQYTDSIVIKGTRSAERLLDEVSLFLHTIRAAPVPREVDVSLDGRTVLVVDDDMRNIFALSKALRSKGLKVLMAQDGHKALKQLESNEDIELVLMDIMMPGMDGYETMRAIRERGEFETLPIIALTAKAMLGDREKCLDAGANDYLSKPIDVDKLLSMMRVWVRPRV